jgi:predicted ATPase
MLKHLHLENFKAFRQLDLPLRPLTLLTGVNSMGKSSVLQALLLLRQSYQRQPYPEQALNLHLNAHLVQMGTANDVFYKLMTSPDLSLGLALDEAPQTALWRYAFGTAQELSLIHI